MENKHFDKYLKDSLENLGEGLDQGNWELLQQKMMLDPDLGVDASESVDFDQSIREKLQGLENQYDPTHWAAMESRLDSIHLETTIEELEFDHIIRENLNDLRIPYNHAHWTLMSNRLDEEFSLRRKLYKYKVAEVALMLLAIFTLFQYLPLHKISSNTIKVEQTIPVEASSVRATAANDSHLVPSELETMRGKKVIAQVNTPEKGKSQKKQITDSTPPTSSTPVTIATGPVIEQVDAKAVATKKSETPVLVDSYSAAEVVNTIAISNLDQPTETNQSQVVAKEEIVARSNETDLGSANVTLLALSSLKMNLPEVSFMPSPSICRTCHHKKGVSIRLGMFLSSDFNEIITPKESAKFEQFDKQITIGYGGGITLGFKHRKWEIETGISYARVSYEPIQQIIYQTGSVLIDEADPQYSPLQNNVFDAAFLNVLKVPLNLNYTFDHIGKWHLYATGGAAVNVLALNHFNIRTTAIGNDESGAILRDDSEDNGLSSPEYNGLLEGGNFQTNSYFTANVGMGIERYLNAQWSVFMQPTYQYLIYSKGFGPNRDRFNTFSIQIGAKSTFK